MPTSVAGGTASGKSTVCKRLMETLGQNDKSDVEKKVVSLSQVQFGSIIETIQKSNFLLKSFDFL